jgi:hypothetical protein
VLSNGPEGILDDNTPINMVWTLVVTWCKLIHLVSMERLERLTNPVISHYSTNL